MPNQVRINREYKGQLIGLIMFWYIFQRRTCQTLLLGKCAKRRALWPRLSRSSPFDMLMELGSVAAIYTWWYLWSRKRMRSRNATGRSRTANGWTWKSSWPMNMFTRRIGTSCERTWAKRSRASRSIVTKRFIHCWRRNTKFSILLQVLQLIHPCRNISPNFDCTSIVNKNWILETELSVQWIMMKFLE